jgi:hypothetical protein
MSSPARGFVRSAPSKFDKTRSVDLRITDMAARDALWWDARLGPKHITMATRADRFWTWSVFLPMAHLVQLAKRRYCRPLVIWARADDGLFLRVGMSILIENYPYLDVSRPNDSYFVWFISAADPDVLAAEFGMSHPPALGRVLLDNAIVLSQNSGLAGRVGLHAAAAGGSALKALYAGLGLTEVPKGVALPKGVHRKNVGGFFYADETQTEAMALKLDPRR